MGILSSYSKSAIDYYYLHKDRDSIFKISDVNARFLKKHGIKSTVKDFKCKVRKSKPFARVPTGGTRYVMKSTPLYKITD